MRVRVKDSLVENFYGFHGINRYYPGDEFTLVAKKDKNGKTISVNDQFSSKWMEKISKGKKEEKEEETELFQTPTSS